jgi:hypothetical protein
MSFRQSFTSHCSDDQKHQAMLLNELVGLVQKLQQHHQIPLTKKHCEGLASIVNLPT